MPSRTANRQQRNVASYALLWLDAGACSSEEDRKIQQQLQRCIGQLKIFNNEHECEEHIRRMPQEAHLILITHSLLGQAILPRVHELQQVFSIYVYGTNTTDKQWAEAFPKTKAVLEHSDELIDRIHSDHSQRQRLKIDEAFSISIFTTSVDEGQSTSEINGHFIYSQLLIDCLTRRTPNANDRMEFISQCKKYYADDRTHLETLNEFEQTYHCLRALWWYTKQSFLYRLLNKALRVQNVDLLFHLRFFIHDLAQQLETHRCLSPTRIYRGQLISKDELKMLKANVGEFIAINAFLSTSLDRELALFFITDSDVSGQLERVFFEIDADSQLENIKPFSNITSHSYFPDEEEVLFMMASIFQLVAIHCRNDGSWIVRMKLSSGNDHKLKPLLDYLKSDQHDGDDLLLSFSNVLLKMGQFDQAEKYYHRVLDKLPADQPYLARCYHALGSIAMKKGDLTSSLIWFHKSLKIQLRTLKSDDLALASSYKSIGIIHRKKEQPDRSMAMFEKALAIWKKTCGEESIEVARCYCEMGNVRHHEERFSEALELYQRAFNVFEKRLPKYHHLLGASYNNMASAHERLSNVELALTHANLALDIFEKSLPSNSARKGCTLYIIGRVKEKQGQFQEALLYFKEGIHIYRQVLLATHYFITNAELSVERISSQLKW